MGLPGLSRVNQVDGPASISLLVGKRHTPQRDLHPLDLGDIAEADLSLLIRQSEHHLRLRAMQCIPVPHPPLEGVFH